MIKFFSNIFTYLYKYISKISIHHMITLKHLLTFEKYNISSNEMTYKPNGDHIWDADDTILSLFFFRIKERNRKYSDTNSTYMNDAYSHIEEDLKNYLGMDIIELAEDIIGCSESALDINSMVTEHYVTGADTGRENGNYHQVNLPDDLKEKTIEELAKISEKIVQNIFDDETRLSQNEKSKSIRLNRSILTKANKLKLAKETTDTERKKLELERDLKSAKLKNAKPISNIHVVDIEIGTQIEHPKFGYGEVINNIDDKKSLVKFKAEIGNKEMINSYIAKFSY